MYLPFKCCSDIHCPQRSNPTDFVYLVPLSPSWVWHLTTSSWIIWSSPPLSCTLCYVRDASLWHFFAFKTLDLSFYSKTQDEFENGFPVKFISRAAGEDRSTAGLLVRCYGGDRGVRFRYYSWVTAATDALTAAASNYFVAPDGWKKRRPNTESTQKPAMEPPAAPGSDWATVNLIKSKLSGHNLLWNLLSSSSLLLLLSQGLRMRAAASQFYGLIDNKQFMYI